jgi:hypothetical protein
MLHALYTVLFFLYRNQQHSYYEIVEELSRTCDELDSTLKNMEFFNNRNARVAEMMIEVDQINSRHRQKSNCSRSRLSV